MRVSEHCARCLYERQCNRTKDEGYLQAVRSIIENRGRDEPSPLLVYRFNQEYEKRFGRLDGYAEVKRHYNDLMLGMEEQFRKRIEESSDPLKLALAYARTGNYIDYGAMDSVDEATCLSLFDDAAIRSDEEKVYERFLEACEAGKQFLLICDNCGEVVLDKLLLEQIKKRFPYLELRVLVRGKEVLNDVTPFDAVYTGIDKVAEVLSNGAAVAGTVYSMLPEDSRLVFEHADIVLAKGQGNYESLAGQGWHIFYTFLCKCDLFTGRFNVPLYTGMLVEEFCDHQRKRG